MVSPWSVKPVMDVFVQRTIEHGLWTFFRQQTSRIINQRSSTLNSTQSSPEQLTENPNSKYALASTVFSSITMNELSFMFGIYLFGNSLAIFVFCCEQTIRTLSKMTFAKKIYSICFKNQIEINPQLVCSRFQ